MNGWNTTFLSFWGTWPIFWGRPVSFREGKTKSLFECVCVCFLSVWLIVKTCLGTLGIAPELHFLLRILKGIEILPASLVMKTGLFIEILAMDNDPFQSALYKTTIISTVVDINQPLSIVVEIKNNLIYEYTPVNHPESSCIFTCINPTCCWPLLPLKRPIRKEKARQLPRKQKHQSKGVSSRNIPQYYSGYIWANYDNSI